MKRIPLWMKVIGSLALLILLFGNPFTRKLIITILPLGFGWDDFVFWIAFFALLIVLFAKGVVSLPKIKHFLDRLFYGSN